MTLYKLTDDEVNLVEMDRASKRLYKERAKKQAECDHSWAYKGSYHNDSVYDCNRCGLTKFE